MARDIEEPGKDYISVSVERNGILIYKRDAVLNRRVSPAVTRWKIDDSDFILVQDTQDPIDIAKRLMEPKGQR